MLRTFGGNIPELGYDSNVYSNRPYRPRRIWRRQRSGQPFVPHACFYSFPSSAHYILKFTEFDLSYSVLDSILSLGFEEATPIQEEAIPLALDGKDLIACAQTGTGKTGAYLIPVIERLSESPSGHIRALIIAPTRELAEQIDQNVDAMSYFTGVSSVVVIGGKDAGGFDRQKYAIQNGVDIVIATPGRLLTHMDLNYVDFSQVEFVILDEADKMLDMGFHADILKILKDVPENRQTLMFSATMPKRIRELAKQIQKEPIEINFNLSKPAAGVAQRVFFAYDDQKIPLLQHIVETEEVESMLIFASSKVSVDEIHRKLDKLGYDVRAMHSDKTQEERQETLRLFKAKQFKIIVGTDVLARGIDIDNLSHVLNFDTPRDAEDYVHRVGRTARASATGKAITFVNPRDMRRLAGIESLIESEIPRGTLPDELGDGPEYRAGGGGHRGGGGGRHGGGERRGGGGGRGRRGGGGRGPRSEAGQSRSQSSPNQDRSEGRPKKKRNRNRNRNRNRGGGGGGNQGGGGQG